METDSRRSRETIQRHDHLTIYVNNGVEDKINDILIDKCGIWKLEKAADGENFPSVSGDDPVP